jgi:hypothetical protein
LPQPHFDRVRATVDQVIIEFLKIPLEVRVLVHGESRANPNLRRSELMDSNLRRVLAAPGHSPGAPNRTAEMANRDRRAISARTTSVAVEGVRLPLVSQSDFLIRRESTGNLAGSGTRGALDRRNCGDVSRIQKQIPYRLEQGTTEGEQGIATPCSL